MRVGQLKHRTTHQAVARVVIQRAVKGGDAPVLHEAKLVAAHEGVALARALWLRWR